MTPLPQISDMEAKQVADRLLIERYLAGQLGASEADALEGLLTKHPELADEVERVARMKTGLALLKSRGELTALLSDKPRVWYGRRWVAAASVVVCLLGGLAAYLATSSNGAPLVLASSLAELSQRRMTPLRVADATTLTRTRGGGNSISIDAAADAEVVELRLATGALEGNVYGVELLRVASGRVESVGRVSRIAVGAGGTAVLYVSASALVPGNYLIRLKSGSDTVAVEYPLQVTAIAAGR